MNKEEFQQFLNQSIVLLDGATGSNLQKNGMPAGICVEQWVCEHEEVLQELQKDYIRCGSQIVYASTFGANRIKLKEFGLEEQAGEINRRAVAVSLKAAQGKALVAGDITMTGQQLEPLGPVTFEEVVEVYKEQMSALEQAGADLLVVETMMSLQETRAALIAAKEAVSLPVMATMSFDEEGRTLYGTDAKTAAIVLESLGAAALGINCSAGPDKMRNVVRQMREAAEVPIIAKPNAGIPKLGKNGITEYDMPIEEFAEHMAALAQEGASVLGGCCGTSPEYIQAVKEKVQNINISFPASDNRPIYITSERRTIEWNEECSIGRIGNSNMEELNEDWEEEIYDSLYNAIDDYEDQDVLCICVDGSPAEREEMMRRVVKETVGYTSIPLVFQSAYPQVLEAALRIYPGRAGILAAEGQEPESLTAVAAEYGAVLLETPISFGSCESCG
ncbi:MAG: 5-methyltetrahydrofolate--homocysteine methyltransferase [Lachnospiraceae bacterium]|nr:5-methyltetrahydrofolate--homocysteine methyltransferase [Lachnospiraceae bacterium]